MNDQDTAVTIIGGQPSSEVVFIRTDNAIAMYHNDRLVSDGVFLNREMVLNALGIEHSTFDADDLWWSEQAGCLFPARLGQVKIATDAE
jgi:hypothetical protein